eukprot:7378643-Prymnesium_polylepis.1
MADELDGNITSRGGQQGPHVGLWWSSGTLGAWETGVGSVNLASHDVRRNVIATISTSARCLNNPSWSLPWGPPYYGNPPTLTCARVMAHCASDSRGNMCGYCRYGFTWSWTTNRGSTYYNNLYLASDLDDLINNCPETCYADVTPGSCSPKPPPSPPFFPPLLPSPPLPPS